MGTGPSPARSQVADIVAVKEVVGRVVNRGPVARKRVRPGSVQAGLDFHYQHSWIRGE
jgi:hypothetical protein